MPSPHQYEFVPAAREQSKARIALTGPSGSGKTYTGLTIAEVLGPRVAVIDTERKSAAKYAPPFTFQVLNLTRFEPTTLTGALDSAARQGFDVVMIDSFSHFWSGVGGMLEQADLAGKRNYGGNSFGGWKEVRPQEREMLDAIAAFPGHVIVTMRSKTEYVIEERGGKKVPRKVGMAPEQRANIEYEFDIVGDMDLDNTLVISKSRAETISGRVEPKPGKEFATEILDWLNSGIPLAEIALAFRDEAIRQHATADDLRDLHARVKAKGLLAYVVPDNTNEDVTLDKLIRARGTEAAAAEQARNGGDTQPQNGRHPNGNGHTPREDAAA